MIGGFKNKKGVILELIVIMVVGLVAVLFFAGWMYGMRLVNTSLSGITTPIAGNNSVASISADTFSYYNTALNGLTLISFMIFFGFIIGSIIMAYYSREKPILLVAYILCFALIMVFSAYISNEYNKILDNSVLSSTLQEFTLINNLLSHLPVTIGILGFLTLSFMIYFSIRSSQEL